MPRSFHTFAIMQKAVVIIMMMFLCLGLTQPGGFMQYHDLSEMYSQCSMEDHDITPIDFVFEHLFNLESIVNILEGEHEYQMDDQAHQPFLAAQSMPLVLSAPPCSFQFDVCNKAFLSTEKRLYPISNANTYLSRFYANIFRPPIAV